MDETKIIDNQTEFIARVKKYVHRDCVDDLLNYLLKETDFFNAPCSTRFHLSVPGGLVAHSLGVDDNFDRLCELFAPEIPEDSRRVCALFHDVCKANCYKPVKKSRKTGRLLPNGKPEWEDYIGYDFDEDFPYGHGEKSVYILQRFIKLTHDEAMAIRWHMGFSDPTFKGGQQSVSNAMSKCPRVALLHAADLIATAYEE